MISANQPQKLAPEEKSYDSWLAELFFPEHLIFQFSRSEKITVDIGIGITTLVEEARILSFHRVMAKILGPWRDNVITHTRIIRGFCYKVPA